MKRDPNVTLLFERKQAARGELAQLPFEEKIAIVRRLQKRRAAIKQSVRNTAARKTDARRNGKG